MAWVYYTNYKKYRVVDPEAGSARILAAESQRQKSRRSLVLRLGLYLLLPFIGILPLVGADLYTLATQSAPAALSNYFNYILGMTGAFNATLFLLDPIVLAVLKYERAKRKQGGKNTVSIARSTTSMTSGDQPIGLESLQMSKIEQEAMSVIARPEEVLDPSSLDHKLANSSDVVFSTPQNFATKKESDAMRRARKNGSTAVNTRPLVIHVQREVISDAAAIDVLAEELAGL